LEDEENGSKDGDIFKAIIFITNFLILLSFLCSATTTTMDDDPISLLESSH